MPLNENTDAAQQEKHVDPDMTFEFELDTGDVPVTPEDKLTADAVNERNANPMFSNEDEHRAPIPGVTKQSSLGLMIAVGLLAMLIIVGGVGYVGMLVLGRGGEPTRQADSGHLNTMSTENSLIQGDSANDVAVNSQRLMDDVGSSLAEESNLSRQAPGVAGQSLSAPEANSIQSDPLLITYGDMQTDELALATQSPPSQEYSQLTVEDEMYDELLAKVSTMDVPTEAIKIDQSVIKRKADGRRLQTLEAEIKGARESVGEIKTAVMQMQSQLNVFGDGIAKADKNNEKISSQVGALTKVVTDLNSKTERELTTMQRDMAALKKATQKAADDAADANRKAGERTVVRVAPAPIKPSSAAAAVAPAKVQVQVHPTTALTTARSVEMPTPQRPVKVVAPVQAAQRAQVARGACVGKAISSVWRVKGVSTTSAYIVRPEDGYGLLLRSDTEVPGFGIVSSFDPTARSVCTSSGLIRR